MSCSAETLRNRVDWSKGFKVEALRTMVTFAQSAWSSMLALFSEYCKDATMEIRIFPRSAANLCRCQGAQR